MTRREADILRAYWRQTYPAVRVRKDGTVEAKKRHGSPWGILETPEQARRSAAELLAVPGNLNPQRRVTP